MKVLALWGVTIILALAMLGKLAALTGRYPRVTTTSTPLGDALDVGLLVVILLLLWRS